MVLFLPWPEYRDLEIFVTIPAGNPLTEVFLCIPTTLCSVGLEVLVPMEGMFVLVGIIVPLDWEFTQTLAHFGFLRPLSQ